jgi:hypothetical protein
VTKTPSPTVTKTPTKAPTATVSPSPTQKPLPTAIPTFVPPTATKAPFQTSVEFSLFLHGIGKGGDNTNRNALGNMTPVRTWRQVEITMYNLDRVAVSTVSANMVYNPAFGNYQGSVILPNVQTDLYQFAFRSDGFLRKFIPGAQNITRLGQNKLPELALVAGDTNRDNKVSVLDYNRILDCFSDLNAAKNCTTDKKLLTDLNDDNSVNQFDYNLFLRELAVQSGE